MMASAFLVRVVNIRPWSLIQASITIRKLSMGETLAGLQELVM
jgi:hypothetical protein